MQTKEDLTRRRFLQQSGVAALVGATASSRGVAKSWTPPPTLTNPNILIVMVDQMRLPAWLSARQLRELGKSVLPNIVGRIQNNAYTFDQFFAAATACTPSRATLLTGLYAPQTAMYITGDGFIPQGVLPALNPAYPTWGEAVTTFNSAYRDNVWWFGKWHLSDSVPLNSTPLLPYGFRTRTYPGGPTAPYNDSPNGTANEGTNGGVFKNKVHASDAEIAGDFLGWIEGQAPTSGLPASPWCATVSFVNPHDITFAPAWLQTNPFPPTGVPQLPVYYPPPSGNPPSLLTHKPHPWNFEDLRSLKGKPGLQYGFWKSENHKNGPVTDWVLFLNQYYWLQNFVDQQIGLVLNALESSPFAKNTIVVFLADHGEYGGSHGLHDKGFAVYDEAIRVPLCVHFPGQTGSMAMNQMCSSVDFFGLICDLAVAGSGQWRTAFPDLAHRQSLWSFLYQNSVETRVAATINSPYILHTFDEVKPGKGATDMKKSHIVCLRTKYDPNAGDTGAKLAYYWEWGKCTTYPNSTIPDPEFYDYNPQTTNNTAEIGNDYDSSNPTTQKTIAQYTATMGAWGPPASGLIGSELNAPLTGTGTDGKPLTEAQAAARQAYYDYAYGKGTCTV